MACGSASHAETVRGTLGVTKGPDGFIGAGGPVQSALMSTDEH